MILSRPLRLLLIPFLCAVGSLILFLNVTAPLQAYWDTGIPSSASNLESPPWRTGIAGDHLQLLYHFDLAADMVEGKIPRFTNPYEFNTGSDEDRFRPGAYFAPMSLVYALLRPFAGQAAAWNTTLWISIWMSAWFGWLWLSRYSPHGLATAAGVLLLLAVPFRWGSLLGGSPAGIALMWVPYFLWRLDKGLLHPRFRDGFLIGLGLILLFWADLQTFYLTALSAPVFALITIGWHWESVKSVFRSWWKLLPGGLICLTAIALFYRWRKSFLTGSLMSEGRSWHELAIFSPRSEDLLTARPGPGETVYVGIGVFMLLGVCLVLALWWVLRAKDRNSVPRSLVCLLAGIAIAFGICVALGTNGPKGGWAILQMRNHIPYFDMIRQSFKVFAVVPVLMAWMVTIGIGAAISILKSRTYKTAVAISIVISAFLLFTYSRHIHTTVCILPSPQEAYAAVADHAADRGLEKPGILVLPLWPGDSAETSVPMHLAQAYGLRMVNGYSPVVSSAYLEEVFRPLESINQGQIGEEQVKLLHDMNVEYLLVHADRFPEKVSPFPIRTTLTRLDASPLLKRLTQFGPVHAYQISSPHDETESAWDSSLDLRIPARRYEAESLLGVTPDLRRTEPGTQGGSFVHLDSGTLLKTPPARVVPEPENHWHLRVRGNGTLRAETVQANASLSTPHRIPIDQSDWEWVSFPMTAPTPFQPGQLLLSVESGRVDLDVMVLSGNQTLHIPKDGLRLPASFFFHAGYADPVTESVHFRPSHDPATVVWYGPLLPLDPGSYTFRLRHRSEVDPYTFGELRSGFHREVPVHVLSVEGSDTTWTWEVPHSKLWRVEFVYNRSAPLELLELEIIPYSAE